MLVDGDDLSNPDDEHCYSGKSCGEMALGSSNFLDALVFLCANETVFDDVFENFQRDSMLHKDDKLPQQKYAVPAEPSPESRQ